MSRAIKKIVLPVGGLGTRFLPATKAMAKEMITLVDQPLIQYVVEEAAQAGIEQVILVTHSSKAALENHFDVNFELEAQLEAKNKHDLLEIARGTLPSGVTLTSVRQPRALGLGHAILCAKPLLGTEDFAVALPDVLMRPHHSGVFLREMLARFSHTGLAQILVEQVAAHQVDKYGIVDLGGADLQAGASQVMRSIVEKPPLDQAPSNWAVTGRYVLPHRILDLLERTAPGAGGEIQLTDAIFQLMAETSVEAFAMAGQSYDCGDKLGYLKASVDFALAHAQLGPAFEAWLKARVVD
jgi:UTP--glucose-1-phosphate uridylyltransferase